MRCYRAKPRRERDFAAADGGARRGFVTHEVIDAFAIWPKRARVNFAALDARLSEPARALLHEIVAADEIGDDAECLRASGGVPAPIEDGFQRREDGRGAGPDKDGRARREPGRGASAGWRSYNRWSRKSSVMGSCMSRRGRGIVVLYTGGYCDGVSLCKGILQVGLLNSVAGDEKFGRFKQLMTTGKEKGYVLYDEVNDLLAEDYPGGRELDDLLTELDTAGVEILEEPKLEFDKKAEEAEEPGELDLVQEFSDKTNDPGAHVSARDGVRFRC